MDLAQQRERLLQLLQEYSHEGNGANTSEENLKDYSHELTLVDNHPADIATENYLKSLDNALTANSQYIARQISEAIQRVDEGTYGTCAHCGKDIPEERLQAIPWTASCIQCSHEELGGSGKRPTDPGRHKTAFWPVLESYGTSDSAQDKPRK